jgi:hypothetical protein
MTVFTLRVLKYRLAFFRTLLSIKLRCRIQLLIIHFQLILSKFRPNKQEIIYIVLGLKVKTKKKKVIIFFDNEVFYCEYLSMHGQKKCVVLDFCFWRNNIFHKFSVTRIPHNIFISENKGKILKIYSG